MTILIEDLCFETILGILPKERLTPQRVCVDCTIAYTHKKGRFIDYANVAERIISTMQTERFELIETALETVAAILKTDFPLIETITLTIRKPDILSNCVVGVRHTVEFPS